MSDLGDLARTLLSNTRRDRRAVGVIAAALVIESLFGALIPVAIGHLIDRSIPERNVGSLTAILGTLGVGAILVSAVGVLRDYLYARVQSGILRNLRVAMFERLQRLSLDWFGRTQSGDILARFSGDLAAVDAALLGAPPWVFLPAVDVVIATVVLFWLDWRLALLGMLIWPACLVGPRYFGRRATAAADERKRDEGDTLAAVHENVAAQTTLRLFLLGREAGQRFTRRADQLAASSHRLGFASAMVERSAGVGINTLRVLVLGVGAVMAFTGSLTLGRLASFQAVFLVLSSALSWISQYAPTMLQAAGSMRRVRELLEEETEPADDEAKPDLGSLRRGIELRGVTYEYPNGRRGVELLSLTIPRNSSVAIVGPSGSGKSTMLGLLLRLHDPTRGSILLDGRNLREGSVASLRRRIGVVTQDSFLFSASLGENIRLGRPQATRAEVEAAARAAEIHEFIESLPSGYDTRVGDGGLRLSGGQRQRVAIARALVRNPDLLLLDEATSALDAATEAAVNATIREMSAGRTVVSVTHRLSTVAAADRIFVLSGGRLVEDGTHEGLLGLGGVYHTLWHKQHGFLTAGEDGGGRIEVTPARLRRVPLLSSLDDATLEELAGMFVVERRPAGTALVYEGEAADKFYIIVRGRVEVTRTSGDEAAVLAILDDGDYFGEMGLLQDVPRNATVRTQSECSCLVLDRERFRTLIARVPELKEELMARMSKRQSMTTPALGVAAH